jgi:hypothetical protein
MSTLDYRASRRAERNLGLLSQAIRCSHLIAMKQNCFIAETCLSWAHKVRLGIPGRHGLPDEFIVQLCGDSLFYDSKVNGLGLKPFSGGCLLTK